MSEQNKSNTSELVDQLNKLGENLGNLLRAAWESEERKSVEREVTAGLDQMSAKLSETAEKIRNDAYLNNAKKQAQDAWETARGPQIVSEVQQGVMDTLKRINEELARRTAPAQEATAESVKTDEKPE
jgi:uncharacterized membrane protein YccC